MNIVFVYSNAIISKLNNSIWRGILFFNSLKKTGLHNVDLIDFESFSINKQESKSLCNNANIIFIEGSPEIDLLTTINHWKSRGKKVIVDIPLVSESQCQYLTPKTESLFSISHVYSNYHENEGKGPDQSEKFRWGLHLADCIMVSSIVQQEQWASIAPVRVFPEFIDLDSIHQKTRINDNTLVIAIASKSCERDEFLESVIDRVNNIYPDAKWIDISSPRNNLTLKNELLVEDFPSGIIARWPDFLPIIDLGLFWDNQILRGVFYRNILEFMGMQIPWVLNDARGYQDLSKYGLIIHNHMNWDELLEELIHKSISNINDSNEGYLYSIGQNNDEHILDLLNIFSEILKTPS